MRRWRARVSLLAFAALLGAGAFVLEWMEYQYLARRYSLPLVTLLSAAGCLGFGVWLGRQLTPRTPEPARNDAALRELGISPREYAVLERLCAGESTKEIARRLGVSPNTVKSHLQRLFNKLEVQSRTQAIARARALRLIA